MRVLLREDARGDAEPHHLQSTKSKTSLSSSSCCCCASSHHLLCCSSCASCAGRARIRDARPQPASCDAPARDSARAHPVRTRPDIRARRAMYVLRSVICDVIMPTMQQLSLCFFVACMWALLSRSEPHDRDREAAPGARRGHGPNAVPVSSRTRISTSKAASGDAISPLTGLSAVILLQIGFPSPAVRVREASASALPRLSVRTELESLALHENLPWLVCGC